MKAKLEERDRIGDDRKKDYRCNIFCPVCDSIIVEFDDHLGWSCNTGFEPIK